LDRRLRFNGAIFLEKWHGVQIGVSGPNGITSIFNAGNAESKGIEGDVSWNILDNLNLSVSGTYVDAKLTTDFCKYTFDPASGVAFTPTSCAADEQQAPKGTRLPVTPKVKGSATLRYEFNAAGLDSFVQGSILHRSESTTYLKLSDNAAIGNLPGFTTADLSAGTGSGGWTLEMYVENVFDKRGVLGRNPQCVVGNCLELSRIYPAKPRIIGVKFGQRF
jgi:outer membrane receptor protein involved in Fe transport